MAGTKPQTAPLVKPRVGMTNILYGEIVSGKLVSRGARILEITNTGHPILRIFRQGPGLGSEQAVINYSPELAEGCWTYLPGTTNE